MRRQAHAALRLLFEQLPAGVVWRLAVSSLLALAGGLIAGLAPLALKRIVDEVAATARGEDWFMGAALAGAGYLGSLALGRVLSEVRPVFSSLAEQRLFAALRSRYFAHALGLPLAVHQSRQPGAIQNALQQAISGYQIVLYSLVGSILPIAVESLTVGLVLHSLGQYSLAIAFGTTAVAYLASMAWCSRRVSVASQEVVAANAGVSQIFADAMINVEPIKCFGTEKPTRAALDETSAELVHGWAGLHRQRMLAGLAVTAVFIMSTGTSLMIAVNAVADGSLTIGAFVLVTVYLAQILRPLEMLATAIRDLTQGLAFIAPLQALFEQPSEAEAANAAPPAARSDSEATKHRPPQIRFQDVSLAFRTSGPVLRELNLDIAPGQSIAIVGASGCGKSTLARLLLRFCEPQSGHIMLDGMPIGELPISQLRAMIAVVPQDIVLFNTTIAANIAVGKADATREEVIAAARLAQLHEMLSALPQGYETVVGERGLTLSGGERQRIAIARAILRDPLVYVLDEATSMLDSATEAEVLETLRQHASGKTTLVIAHRLSAIQHLEDIIVIADGRVTERGTHSSLMARDGAYTSLWRAQAP